MVRSKSLSKAKRSTVKKSARSKRSSIDHPFKSMQEEEDSVDLALLQDAEAGIGTVMHAFFKKHIDNYETSYGRWFEGTMFFLNFLAIAFFIADTHNVSDWWHSFFSYGELVLVSFFIIEYGLRMWVAEKKVHHFFNVYSLIDLVAIIPVLAQFANLTFVRMFRILRLFRILRILRFQRAFKGKKTLFGYLTDTELIVIRIVLTVFTIIFVSAGFIWAIESAIQPDGFGTIWHALYFAIVTLSTVGYGDLTPLSPLGRAVTVVMILTGVALIPWQLGKLLKVIVTAGQKHNIECKQCGLVGHETDALHCRRCGYKIRKHANEDMTSERAQEIEEYMIE